MVPPTRDGTPKCGRGRFDVDGRRPPAAGLEDDTLGGGGDIGQLHHQGSDGGRDIPILVFVYR